jgi:hypothetical protein
MGDTEETIVLDLKDWTENIFKTRIEKYACNYPKGLHLTVEIVIGMRKELQKVQGLIAILDRQTKSWGKKPPLRSNEIFKKLFCLLVSPWQTDDAT